MAKGHGEGAGSGAFSGYTCIKYMFFIFNVIFWLLGCALLGVGIWLHVSEEVESYSDVTPDENYFSVTSVCIAAGCIMIIVSFFGCCGAVMENKCMLVCYFVLVMIIFIMQITFGILAFIYRDDIDHELKKELKDGINKKYGHSSSLTKAWDEIQQKQKCCGVHNETDWYVWAGGPFVPDSCCEFETDGCGRLNATDSTRFSKGCYNEVKDEMGRYLYILGIFGLTVGVLQILGLVASMALVCFLRSEKYDDYYET